MPIYMECEFLKRGLQDSCAVFAEQLSFYAKGNIRQLSAALL